MYFVLCVTNLALWLQETNKNLLTYFSSVQMRCDEISYMNAPLKS